MLIQLTGADGKALLVNTAHVVRARGAQGQCEIWLVSNERLVVREGPAEIAKAARLAGA
jgi:uncharacterized protein YlzI (FlbEa/FlbD family)